MSERNYAYINELVPTAQAAVAGDFWGCKQGNPAVFRNHKYFCKILFFRKTFLTILTLFSQCATMSIVIVMTKHFATTIDEYKTKESKRSAVFYEKKNFAFLF
ncbi:MAG: hypothetical protein ACLSHM_00780 [Vescimonas sp.]